MDIEFLVGEFLQDNSIQKDKVYLYKHFRSRIQRIFVQYMVIFRDTTFFLEHSGCSCSMRLVARMREKLNAIEKAHAEAKSNMDIERLSMIENGKIKFEKRY